ncbi:hypothetical protein AKJ47_02540 [candidate division MSBL1 archaeon SCGC-AAA261G05]|uniref:Uncharacterized protein n=1 Tax=candidate division MSBL1 archaeon SCGC-AAA261G05 TaxID=1698276 RepID=A0A133VA24_9EURY|nr:hypothetical protein AKJ47_02540 [candidate division MSBL1 archaeon SCGC-AAA261G05]
MEKVVQSLAEAQVERGHTVNVLTSRCGAKGDPKKEVLNGVTVSRLEFRRKMSMLCLWARSSFEYTPSNE